MSWVELGNYNLMRVFFKRRLVGLRRRQGAIPGKLKSVEPGHGHKKVQNFELNTLGQKSQKRS